jgi:hypothetical protein
LIAVDRGLEGNYFANDSLQGPVEKSTEYRSLAATRIDSTLIFGPRTAAGPDGTSFPLYFFNNVNRFNFYGRNGPDRASLPFSVRWHGYFVAEHDAPYTFVLQTPNHAALWIDQVKLGERHPGDSGESVMPIRLSRGTHPIKIQYRNPQGAPRSFSIGLQAANGFVPLSGGELITRPYSMTRLYAARLANLLGVLVDLSYLLMLAGLAYWTFTFVSRQGGLIKVLKGERLMLSAALTAGLVASLVWWFDLRHVMLTLGGGEDWLTYESYSRDILLSGPLMRSSTEGHVFYFQIFYPYYLAMLHGLLGEDLFGVFAMQSFCLVIVGAIIYFIAKRLWGSRAAGPLRRRGSACFLAT